MLMRNFSDFFDINQIGAWVSDRFDEDGFRLFRDGCFEVSRIFRINESSFDAQIWQSRAEKIVGAAVKRAGSDDLVTRMRNIQDSVRDRSRT